MPRRNSADQVAALSRQKAEIAAKLKQAQAAEREKKKATEQRRFELAGRFILQMVESDDTSDLATAFYVGLDDALNRPSDRALFPMLAGKKNAPATSQRGTGAPSKRGA